MWRLIKAFILLTGGCFVSTVGMLVGFRSQYHDPFSPYSAIMPGQLFDPIEDYPCDLHVGMLKGVAPDSCRFEANDGVFDHVTVVESDQIITRLAFAVQPNSLRLGDLVLSWGQPTRIEAFDLLDNRYFVSVRWGDRVYAGQTVEGYEARLDYFLPLSYILLEHEKMQWSLGK
jgi:hypothetical protein